MAVISLRWLNLGGGMHFKIGLLKMICGRCE